MNQSFIELHARERARSILDGGEMRELLGPHERLKSPWLAAQNIVAQADDGVVVARGRIGGEAAVVLAIEGAFQGGSLGEVSGAKIAGALELALEDQRRGTNIRPVILFETGGVRLQEANLGLAAIAEIHSAIIALRPFVPVVGVIAGMVGCFGGMSIAAALCSHLIVTRQARLGLNGPEVIEQEAGVAELIASDRRTIWGLIGGEQRFATGFVDALVEDDIEAIGAAVRLVYTQPESAPRIARSERVAEFRARLAAIDPAKMPDPRALRTAWAPHVATRGAGS